MVCIEESTISKYTAKHSNTLDTYKKDERQIAQTHSFNECVRLKVALINHSFIQPKKSESRKLKLKNVFGQHIL